MSIRRPSPALVISIISLVVALGGTAVAASHYLITNSSQIKNGTIRGGDLRKHTITRTQLASGLLGTGTGATAAAAPAGDATTAFEAHRLSGPKVSDGTKTSVVSLDLQPGVYAVFAKANLVPDTPEQSVLSALGQKNQTHQGDCRLDVGGDGDYSSGGLDSPFSSNSVTLTTQLTRSLADPATAVLSCETDGVPWHAADASIIAIKVGSAALTETP